MTVWIRIALYAVAGWLFGSGLIGEEVRDILTTDPAVVDSINFIVSAGVFGIAAGWRWMAKRFGWAT